MFKVSSSRSDYDAVHLILNNSLLKSEVVTDENGVIYYTAERNALYYDILNSNYYIKIIPPGFRCSDLAPWSIGIYHVRLFTHVPLEDIMDYVSDDLKDLFLFNLDLFV